MWLPPVLSYMHHYSPNLDTSPCHGAPLFSSHNIALYSPTIYSVLSHNCTAQNFKAGPNYMSIICVCVGDREREQAGAELCQAQQNLSLDLDININ